MPAIQSTATDRTSTNRYRLPGIEREGIAQLSLLETALWPLQGGKRSTDTFLTQFAYGESNARKTATVTVRAPLGLQSFDEYVLWGLLGATLARKDSDPVLYATPFWMLRHLGIEPGGFQYADLRESLLRLTVASYQSDGFYNPETKQREYAAFQFLSMLLPTVGGEGIEVDNDRGWRIEWNPAFFRFCRASGGNLLFDLDLYRRLSPASRRLFLRLKNRFWRAKRVFMNVDDLTVNGLGFATKRPLKKRKYDLLNCIRELLDQRVVELGRGQTDPAELFWRPSKGVFVVSFFEGEYFRRPITQRAISQKNAILDHPLYEPLRKIGVDGSAIRRLLANHSENLIQRWIRITDAAMHEHPRCFPGFRVSAAAFLIDGIQHKRTPPDWMHEHERRQRQKQWTETHARSASDMPALRQQYAEERSAALRTYLASREGRLRYKETYPVLLTLHKVTDPVRCHKTAQDAALERIERIDFRFPDFDVWVLGQPQESISGSDMLRG